jgi:hypothetical protein
VYRPSSIAEHVLQFPVVAKAVGDGADRMTDVSGADVMDKVVEALITAAAVATGCQESASSIRAEREVCRQCRQCRQF